VGRRLRLLLLCLVVQGACRRDDGVDLHQRAITRAARYLWVQQAADGGWHSETYGLLRSGQSLTPFVLNVLLEVPVVAEPPHPDRVERALAFIERSVDADGALGRADPAVEDYPNYATALALRVAVRTGRRELVDRLLAGLRRQQFGEELGWTPEHPAYGAWGMGGPPRRPPHPGHVDLSMTRHVLEGLSAAGVTPVDPAMVRASTFLGRLQNADGGFFFSTIVVDANKAGPMGERWKSYGTVTADGALSLLAMGIPPGDPRLRDARDWLVTNHRSDRVPGFQDAEDRWSTGMVGYYQAASARALAALGVTEAPAGHDWRRELVTTLLAAQRPDGSFLSSSFLMKEDDPLIATTFALSALLSSQSTTPR
jgi:hypothetical protein